MTAERKAILMLLGLATAGQGIRYLVTRPDSAPGDVQILGSQTSRTPAGQKEAARNAHRPLQPGEKIDLDRATAQEIARLPRVGFSMAQRIVAYRDSVGGIGSLERLDQVSGVGPALLRVIGPHITFSNRSVAAPSVPAPAGPLRLNLNTATTAEIEKLPLLGPSRAIAIVEWRKRHGSFKNLDDLILVPGVSRRMAEAIRHLVAF